MYKITFKGKDIEPEYIPENEIGKKFYEAYLSHKLPRIVELVEGRAIEASSIKSVESGYSGGGARAQWLAPEFSREEIYALKKKVDQFTQKDIDGVPVSKQDQYLISQGILSFKNGTFTVKDAGNMKLMDAMFDELDKLEYGIQKRDEELMKQDPNNRPFSGLKRFSDFPPKFLQGAMLK